MSPHRLPDGCGKIGAVLVFKDGITAQKAAEALDKIKDVLDLPTTTTKLVPTGTKRIIAGVGSKAEHKMVDHPFQMVDILNEFDPKYGGPVWYVP